MEVPSANVTVPVGVPPPGLAAVTSAVKVVGAVGADGSVLLDTAVTEESGDTETLVDGVSPEKFVSPG
jgi:hypothetical protein